MKTLTDTIVKEFKEHFSEELDNKNIDKDQFLAKTNLIEICKLYASDLNESRLTGTTIFLLDIASKLLWEFDEPDSFNKYMASFDKEGIVYKVKEIFDKKEPKIRHSFQYIISNINDNSYGKKFETLNPKHLEKVMPLFTQDRVINIYSNLKCKGGTSIEQSLGKIILTEPEKLDNFLDCLENEEIMELYLYRWNEVDSIKRHYQESILWKVSQGYKLEEVLEFAKQLKLDINAS
ncbi:MAG: hypothetical protein KKB39_00900 [Nanoarchaeota archaeon]|nr:hypothetical protein [Nanoarchaeota archaeon]